MSRPSEFPYRVPDVSMSALDRYITGALDSFGWSLDPFDSSFVGDSGPHLEWRLAGEGMHVVFDGDPLRVSVGAEYGGFYIDDDPKVAQPRVSELLEPFATWLVATDSTAQTGTATASLDIKDFSRRPAMSPLWPCAQRVANRCRRALLPYTNHFADDDPWDYIHEAAPAGMINGGLFDLDLDPEVLIAAAGAPRLPYRMSTEVKASFDPWMSSQLATPFVPESMCDRVEKFDEWSWGTRLDAGTPGPREMSYMQGPEVEQFLSGDWRPRFHVCHGGHGVNSYSMNYTLVTERIALFAQEGWGGAYMDSKADGMAVMDMAADISVIVDLAEAIENWPNGRLLVTHSSFRGINSVAWVGGPGEGERQLAVPVPGRSDAPAPTGLQQAILTLERLWMGEVSRQSPIPLPSN